MGALPTSLISVIIGFRSPFAYQELIDRINSSQNVVNSQEEAQLKLISCTKESNENMSMFAEKVRQLAQRAYPLYSENDKDKHALQTFILGLSAQPELDFHMRLQTFKSLQEAKNFAMRLEESLKRKHGDEKKPRPFIVRKTTDVDTQNDNKDSLAKAVLENTEEIRKMSENFKKSYTPGQGNSNKDSVGHRNERKSYYPNNGERSTVDNSPCHTCGQLGHWRPQCPNRQRGLNNYNQNIENLNSAAPYSSQRSVPVVPLNENRAPLWGQEGVPRQ